MGGQFLVISNAARDATLRWTAALHRRKNVQEVAPHMRITDRASTIREKYNVSTNKIKTPDAIHLATAIIYEADEMQTMDGYHDDGTRDGLLALSGNVADYKLLIVASYPRGAPSVPSVAEVVQSEIDDTRLLWDQIVEEDATEPHDE